MAEKKLDRRIIRTRRMLREALLELITNEGYDDLTITALTAHADLRRATFYRHYDDLDDLLLTVLQDLFDEFAQELTSEQPMTPFYAPTEPPHIQAALEYVAANATLYTALFQSRASMLVQRHIRSYLARIKRQQIAAADIDALPMPPDVIANYIAGMEMAMIIWWLDEGMPYSAAELATMMQALLLQGVQSLFDASATMPPLTPDHASDTPNQS